MNKLILNRNFSLLWASQIVNSFGNKLSIFAVPLIGIYIYHTNALQTSIITALSFLPSLLLSPFVGVFVDRYNKKKITVISNGV